MKAPLPPNEAQRLKALLDYGVMDTPPEQEFDDITALVAEICETPIALISLVDETRQWFKSAHGFATRQTAREIAFCAHALSGKELLVVPDTQRDERFAENPSVTGDPNIRFYAGAPLLTAGGEALGTLCVIDRVPRQLTDRQLRALRVLSQHVMTQLELRRHTRELAGRERLLRAIFDAEPECVKVLGPDGSLRMMNRAGLAMIEADDFGQVAGHGINPLITAEHRAAFAALTGRVFRGDSGKLEFQITGLKGAARWLETHAAPLRDERGEVTALLGITRDITARKQTEEALANKSGILAAVNESLGSYVERGDWREAMGRLLRCALDQTQSEYGFIGVVVGPTLRVLAHEGIVWDKIINRDFYEQALRRYEELGYLEFTSFDNLFGRAITTGQVVLANRPDHDPRAAGRPTGHPPMHSFMGVPIFNGQQVHGLVALANRPGGYSGEEQRRIEILVQHAGALCTSYRQRETARALEQERLKAEEALRHSEERFRLLTKATNDAIWDWDLATNLLWWNEGYEKLFGYRREEVDPSIKSWTDYLHPEDLPRVMESIHHVIEHGGEAWSGEYRFRCQNGSYAYVLDRGHVIRNGAGQPVRMIGGMTDQTERKRIEAETHRANETLANIVKVLQEIAASTLPLPQVMHLMAVHAQALTGATGGVIELVEGEHMVYRAGSGVAADKVGLRLQRSGSLSGRAVASGGALVCEDAETDDRVDRAACRTVGVRSMIVVPLRDDRQVIGVLKVMSGQPRAFAQRDVTNLQILAGSLGVVIQRQRAADHLHASEEQYRMIFGNHPDPMWVFAFDSLRFLAVNAAAVEHYGYSEQEFLGMCITDIRPPEDAAKLRRRLQDQPVTGRRNQQVRHRKKNGVLMEVDVTSEDIVFAGNRCRLVVARDITEQVRASLEATRANRALQMLSRCNEALIRAESEDVLLNDICRIAVDVGGARLAWVGYARDDAGKTIAPQSFAGADEGYLAQIKLTWAEDQPNGRGPAGRTIRSGEPVVIPDFSQAEEFRPWLEPAHARGFRGLISLPLKDRDRTFGLFVLYLAEVAALPADEMHLLRELADDLAFGILNLRARVERRRTHEAVLAMARGISASTGADFFDKLTHSMVGSLGAHAGFIAHYVPSNPGLVRSICAVVAGQTVPNFDYPLAGTPCEQLDQADVWVIPQAARRLYPRALSLVEKEVEAYVGTKLTDAAGRPIGLLVVEFLQPLEHPEFIASTLKIFATRAAAELARQDTDTRTREQAALLDKAQDAILVRTLDHHLTYWNKSAERIYGWTAAEALGRSGRELLYADPAPFDQATAKMLAAGEWIGELVHKRKDGASITVESRWTLLRDDEGRPKSVLSINTDITERKKIEQQFLRAQRMESIGTLAGGIAHDLNNLLAPITMGADLLLMFDPNPRSLPVIENMKRSARRGSDLVKQVLSFARGIEGTRVALPALHIIREVEAIAVNTFPKNIAITAEAAPDLWLTLADPTQLNQVLLNLCVNARDAMPDGGRLELQARNVEIDAQYAAMNQGAAPGHYIVIQVTDNGTGMPQAIIDRIFEPFFTTKELGKGSGLGLATVLGIVRSHGGFLNVYSEPGKGTTFKVYLPAKLPGENDAAPGSSPAEEKLPRGNGETILLVDDEAAILHITKETLQTFGYKVLTAEDGAQAIGLYALHRETIAAVLTDMMMPVMDGPALIAALRRINPRVRIIAASGLNANGTVSRATIAGVRHFLAKPYSADVLLTTLKKVLEEPGSRSPM